MVQLHGRLVEEQVGFLSVTKLSFQNVTKLGLGRPSSSYCLTYMKHHFLEDKIIVCHYYIIKRILRMAGLPAAIEVLIEIIYC